MFKEMIITFATTDPRVAKRGKMFRQRCRPLRGEILARSLNNVGVLPRESTKLRGKKRPANSERLYSLEIVVGTSYYIAAT